MCFNVDYDGLIAWGTFVGGIGTAGAFLIAGYAFLVNARANQSTQARMIHAHMPTPPRAFSFNDNGPGNISLDKYADTFLENELVSFAGEDSDFYIEDDATMIWPTLPNRSAEYIFDIELTMLGDGQKWATFNTPTVPPDSVVKFMAVLSPSHRTDADMTFAVEFTDSVGRRWMSRSGRVVRLKKRLRGHRGEREL